MRELRLGPWLLREAIVPPRRPRIHRGRARQPAISTARRLRLRAEAMSQQQADSPTAVVVPPVSHPSTVSGLSGLLGLGD